MPRQSNRSLKHRQPVRLAIALAVITAVAAQAGAALAASGPRIVHNATTGVDTSTFVPSADTFVDASAPDTNYGTGTDLWVDGSPVNTTFIRFPLQGIGSRQVLDVRLRLFQTQQSVFGGRVSQITNDTWDEQTTTWNTNHPAVDGPVLGTFGAVSSWTAYVLDLGPLAVTDGDLNLAIDTTNPDGLIWDSRESGHPPQLLVDLAPLPNPAHDAFFFRPVADASADSSNPDLPAGDQPLWVDADPPTVSYLRFQLNGLTGRTIVGARLRLYNTDGSTMGFRAFTLSSNTWDENTLTWNTRPAVDGSLVGSLGAVAPFNWYSQQLSQWSFLSDGATVSFALDSTDPNGARFRSRESQTPPELEVDVAPVSNLTLDGVSQVATTWEGSSAPTYFPGNRHEVVTTNGRQLLVRGLHNTGVQLDWRDRASGWNQATTGAVTDGVLHSNGKTGDRPASIALAKDTSGVQHAWVVWSGDSPVGTTYVEMRRLSNLDSPDGPTVGPIVVISSAGLGSADADLAFEVKGSTSRGVLTWTERLAPNSWVVMTEWFTDLSSDTPALVSPHALFTSGNYRVSGTLVSTVKGMRVVAHSDNDTMTIYGHDVDKPFTEWWAKNGPLMSSTSYPTGVGNSKGELRVAVEADTTRHIVVVERFDDHGGGPKALLSVTGYSQPTIATDGKNTWLVMVRRSDGAIVSRQAGDNGDFTKSDRVELPGSVAPGMFYPNLVRQTDGRLRFVVSVPGSGPTQTAILAFQRTL